MAQRDKLLHVSITVFKVLAWLALVLQVIVGLILLVVGGDPVLVGTIEIPARLVGVLNCVAGGMYFFVLLLIARVIRLLLEIQQHLPMGPASQH